MKRVTLLITGIIISLFFYQCEIGFNCVLVDEMPEFEALTSYEEMVIMPLFFELDDVFNPDSLENGQEFIINDSTIYQGWADSSANCLACNFPNIDFETKTLIGVYYTLDCNDLAILRFTKDGNNYHHIIKAIDNTQCNFNTCNNYTFGWVTIPKDVNANITFQKTEAYQDCDC